MKRTLAALCLLALLPLVPRHRVLCRGFLPDNDLSIPVGDVSALGIQEAQFNEVLDRVQKIYGPIVAAKGGQLVINRKWTDPTVNASAMRLGNSWQINMYGGLARHAAVTREGFALVACHELGHHLGGFPKSRAWASNEGESDYFATLKCLRLFLAEDPEQGAVDPVAAAGCAKDHPDGPERRLCRGGAMAGHSIASLFEALRPGSKPPAFGTPDPAVVDRTYDKHPAPQCRLDTYFQGALCVKTVSEELSDASPVPGACTEAQGFGVGLRPRCWYKAPAATTPRFDATAARERVDALSATLSAL